jgi:hypothetical protein
MQVRENGTRFKKYWKWEDRKQSPYDYENKGLLKHLLSERITTSKNVILQNILSYIEQSLIFVMKYIDRLKHFKNYHWKNR